MQVAKTVVKEKVETISEREAIERAILFSVARHRISPSNILAVDVTENLGTFTVKLYLRGSPIAVVVEVEKNGGKVWDSWIRELFPE